MAFLSEGRGKKITKYLTMPLLFTELTAAENSNNLLTTTSWPFKHAMCNGVLPYMFTASTSTPRSKRSRTTDIWPLDAAAWSGVYIWQNDRKTIVSGVSPSYLCKP